MVFEWKIPQRIYDPIVDKGKYQTKINKEVY